MIGLKDVFKVYGRIAIATGICFSVTSTMLDASILGIYLGILGFV